MFERSTSGVMLTEAGRELLEDILPLFNMTKAA
jgi:DNA-binding transcriptional LysR family regulator